MRMARTRRGHSAVIRAIDALEGDEGASIARMLASDGTSLQACRYGKVVAAHLASTA